MLKVVLRRDRLVVMGLLMLGAAMVLAGVMSGRSSFHAALLEDARQAALAWANEAEARHAQGRSDAWLESGPFPGAGSRPAGPADADAPVGHVSQVFPLAVLADDGAVLALAPGARDRIAALGFERAFHAAIAAALRSDAPQVLRPSSAEGPGHGRAIILAPARSDEGRARIYVLESDQRPAERMAAGALVDVSIMTSLLIVMGFLIPAVVAAWRIRERSTVEDKMRFLAMHDPLTRLPNRAHLRERLDQAAARARRHRRLMAVLCLDLDRFKDINDTLGHATGDALLEEVSRRLRQGVRETDVIGRLGGDEFAILAEDLDAPEDAGRLARRVCEVIAEPFEINGHAITNSVSIGVALGPDGISDPGELLKHADLALYRAKHDGRATFRFFEPEMDAALQERRRLECDLRQSVANGEIELRYQPQYELASGQLTGYEAVLRWRHPVRGEVPATVFMPLAEETGLVATLGEWALRTACGYAATWPDRISLALNLSPAQFTAQDVVGLVARVLEETGLAPHRLELEITERLLLQNTDKAMETLKRLDRLGVRIAMDDFGTGYSSLSYLTRFPVRKIKIGRSFIDTLGMEPETTAIVSSIVGLGQSLNVTITAEGVETPDQAEMLLRWGCNQVQGYFYGQAGACVVPPAPAAPSDDGEASAPLATGAARTRCVA